MNLVIICYIIELIWLKTEFCRTIPCSCSFIAFCYHFPNRTDKVLLRYLFEVFQMPIFYATRSVKTTRISFKRHSFGLSQNSITVRHVDTCTSHECYIMLDMHDRQGICTCISLRYSVRAAWVKILKAKKHDESIMWTQYYYYCII